MNSCARISAVVLLAALLGGCATDGVGTASVACDVFGPLSWSKHDTRVTVRGIKGHNAAWKTTCPNVKPK